MWLQLFHTVVVATIAAVAGLFGIWYLNPNGGFDGGPTIWVVCASILIWLPFANIYLHFDDSAWIYALYFGFLAPFIGCLLVAPPWSFLVVFSQPLFSFGLAFATSFILCAVSRVLASDE